MSYKILLGGVMAISSIGVALLFTSSTHETPVQEKEVTVELSQLERLILEIQESEEFKNETRLRAEARAMYQLSLDKQDEAVALSSRALETYQMAMTLENDWKINQTIVTQE